MNYKGREFDIKEGNDDELVEEYGNDICLYIEWSTKAGIPLTIADKIKQNPKLLSLCELSSGSKNYAKFFGNAIMSEIPIYNLLVHEILPSLEADQPI